MAAPKSQQKSAAKPKKRPQRLLTYLLGTLLLAAAGGWFYWQDQLQPPSATGEAVAIEIKPGLGAQDVSQLLETQGLIKNATVYSFYLKWNDKSAALKAGKYYITKGMSAEEIANVLVGGDARYGTTKFTVPEGLTVEQIADKLAQDKLVDRDAFLKEANSGVFNYEFLKEIPTDKGLKQRLEGYLFPDTYEVFQGANAHDILDAMLKQTAAVLKPEWREAWKQQGLTIHQGLTIASLVEREAQVDKERAPIAGVIKNRLQAKPPMKLQIDATVQFALGKQKETLLFKDLEINSPYNTYKFEGLPPGPIAAPGKPSIEAAVFPAVHDFYFYVTKKDGSGEHYFATTFAEHEANIRKSQ